MIATRERQDTDVMVVGGGPAGLAAAIALRLAGFDVTVAERRRPPIDKACGEGIMPDGVAILEGLGVRVPPSVGLPFRGVRFVEGRLSATGLFKGESGLGLPRRALHEAMIARAEQLGVRLLWERAVAGFREDGVVLGTGPVRARWIVGADGQSSRVRRWLGLDSPPSSRRYGIRRHISVRPWTDLVEVHWSTRCEAYVTPVAPEQICVAILTDEPRLRFDEALARFEGLRHVHAPSGVSPDDRGGASVFRRAAVVARGRYALVGDAAGSVDAITGEGITLALHQAVALARALAASDPEAYAGAHLRIVRGSERLTAMMMGIDRRSWLRRIVLEGLGASPSVFGMILDFHTRRWPRGRRPGIPVLPPLAAAGMQGKVGPC